MDSLLQFLSNPLVIMAVQMGTGWLVKHKSNAINGAIPLINYVIGVLIQLPGVAFQPTASPANFATAGFLGDLGGFLSNPLISSLIYTLLSTGTHSTAKNVGQLLKANVPAQP